MQWVEGIRVDKTEEGKYFRNNATYQRPLKAGTFFYYLLLVLAVINLSDPENSVNPVESFVGDKVTT